MTQLTLPQALAMRARLMRALVDHAGNKAVTDGIEIALRQIDFALWEIQFQPVRR